MQVRPIDVDTVEALEEALISADVGVAATHRIVEAVRSRKSRGESLRALVKAEILEILRGVGSRQQVLEGPIDYVPQEQESPEGPTIRPPAPGPAPKQDKK